MRFRVINTTIYDHRFLAVFLAYFCVACGTNFYFESIGIHVALVRPSVGLALGVLLVGGRQYWPAVFLGSLAAGLTLGDPISVSIFTASGVSLGAIAGAHALGRDRRFDPALAALPDFVRLMVWGGSISAGIGAALGASPTLLGLVGDTHDFGYRFIRWWMGNVLGIALMTPLILTWRHPPRDWLTKENLPAVVVYFIATFLAGQTIFLGWFNSALGPVALGYWMFAFVVWGASRFGIQCPAVVLPMAAIQALTSAAERVGLFAADVEKSQLLNVWFYLLCLTVVGIGLGATVNGFRSAQVEIRKLAHYDPLTGLPNRLLLSDRIERAVASARRYQQKFAVIFHDLDRFKEVNDGLGHQAGDHLLKAVAERLLKCVRNSDTVARMGGDEFLILLPSIDNAQAAIAVAEKIRQNLLKPFLIDGRELNISTSLGLAIYPDHGTSESELIANADNAMYHAKKLGRNVVQIYSGDLPKIGRSG